MLTALCSLNSYAVETAEQILTRSANKIDQAPSLTVKFLLSYQDSRSECMLQVQKNKFRFTAPDVEIWFDGQTQWALNKSDGELSITEPTDEEIMESNPLAIVNNFKAQFNCRRLSGEKNEIELTAKNKTSNIRKAVITIDQVTELPSKLIVTLSNGRTFSALVSSASIGKALPASLFVYDKNKYPAKTINDLR